MLRYSFIIACLLCVCTGIAYITSSRDRIQAIESLGHAGKVYPHQCRWPLCPYRGIDTAKASKVVANYVGKAGIDAYYIDMLHIKYPTLDADQLDSLLTH